MPQRVLLEGSGLPVPAVMTLGTPVPTSKVASLPEIAGGAARLIDPLGVDDMARGIRALGHDSDLRGALAAKGRARAAFFSPETCCKRVADLDARVLG